MVPPTASPKTLSLLVRLGVGMPEGVPEAVVPAKREVEGVALLVGMVDGDAVALPVREAVGVPKEVAVTLTVLLLPVPLPVPEGVPDLVGWASRWALRPPCRCASLRRWERRLRRRPG